ncbi:hypothetical protein [Kitasatospora sp. NPDC088783]|uniref:hypothetical protein n=1 Tax=Kitasatospora sp. NPDC088783 TaxID=3364077 RepID=UPI00381D1660
MRTELRLVRVVAFLRVTGAQLLLLSVMGSMPALLWRPSRYAPTTLAVLYPAMFAVGLLGTAGYGIAFSARRLAKEPDDLPARFEPLPEEQESKLISLRATSLLLPFVLVFGTIGAAQRFPSCLLAVGGAAGLLVVSRWTAARERERGGRLVYLLVPGADHTGTRLWIDRTPRPDRPAS